MPRAFFLNLIVLGLSGFSLAASAQPAGLDAVSDRVRYDLDSALEELSSVRERIAEEKIPLARRLNELEARLAEQRREYERMARLRDNREAEARRLQDEAQQRRNQLAYFKNLIDDYLEAFEARLHIAELPHFRDSLRQIREDDAQEPRVEGFEARFDMLDRAAERLGNVAGGHVFPGRALRADGALRDGTFALVGPVAVFQGKDTGHGGLAILRQGSLQPFIYPLPSAFRQDIPALMETGEGYLPVDPTEGMAIRREEARKSVWGHIRQGGPVMVPILLLAAIALLVGLYKWKEIAGMSPLPPDELQRILEAVRRGETREAKSRAEKSRGPVGEMLREAVSHAHEGRELVEEVMYEKILRTQPKLDRLMPLIALTAATAPLLGLLGTVTGMIQTFQLITLFGTGDAQTLSGGISEALITTQFGLMVAVPALIVHALLSRKSKGVISNMEQTSIGFINGLSVRETAKDA